MFIYIQLKLIYCKVLLEPSLLSVHYLSSLNYSVASGKTNSGKENFQLKPTTKFFPFFLNSCNTRATHGLHTGCSTLFLGWLPAAVQHMAPSSWRVYFAIRTLQNVRFFPLQAENWSGTGAAQEPQDPAHCTSLQKCSFHTGSQLCPAEFIQQKCCISLLNRELESENK